MEYFGYLQMGHNPEYVDGSQSRIIWTMSLMQCKMITSQNHSGLSQACNLLWIESGLQNLDYVTPCVFWIMSTPPKKLVQGDTSGCAKPLFDIDVKVAF